MSKHKIISFVKSGIRIVGCVSGMIAFDGNFLALHAFALMLVAEIAGVIEEKYEKRMPDALQLGTEIRRCGLTGDKRC
jgi:hypothetical protein